jgi:hypothetical protein
MSKFACHTLVSISLIGLSLSSCKFSEPARDKAVNEGMLVGEKTRDPRKSQVLIHVSNNPVNTSTFLSEKTAILKSFDEAATLLPDRQDIIKHARSLFEKDWDAHTTALATDIADIKMGICNANTGLASGVVIINNSSIVNKRFWYCPINEGEQRVPEALIQPILAVYDRIKTNKLYESSPLSHPEILQASLEMVRKLFPTDKHEYSLIIKSHGNAELAVTSKVAFESALVTGKFIAKYFKSRPARRPIAMLDKAGFDKAGLDKAGFDKAGFDKAGFDKAGFDKAGFDKAGFDKAGFDKAGFDKGGLSSPNIDITAIEKGSVDGPTAIETLDIRAAGISKEHLLQILLSEKHDMFFNVVFLESCNSDIGALAQGLADTPEARIGYLYTSDKDGIGYSTLNYQSARDSRTGSLRVWLVEELNKVVGK